VRREYLLLLAITCIGLFLRFASLLIGFSLQTNLNMSLFPDEANFLVTARYFSEGIFPPQYLYYHNSLILSPIIGGLYSLFGITAFTGRALSVVLGVLTIPLVYLLSKKLFKNERIALLAALLLSISFIHRFWTLRALADGPLSFFFVLSLYLFTIATDSQQWRWYLWAGLSTIVCILIKYPGILIFPIIFIYLIINIYLKKVPKKALLYYLFTLMIFGFVILTLLLSQFALAFQPLNQISYFLNILLSGTSNPFYYIFYTFFLNAFLAFIILILFGIVISYAIKRHSKGDIMLLSWIGIIFIFFSFYGESELYRYLLPAIPALYILISSVFINIFQKLHFSIHKFRLSKESLIALLLMIFLGGFITAELAIGENLIVKRSMSYGGIYRMSSWLTQNGTQGAGIMAPSNSLAQFEFYTNNNFQYYALSTAGTELGIWNYVQSNNISYIILSEHFPETLSMAVFSLVPNDLTHYSLNFSYSDGKFETALYLVKT
jgi:4-amino-4-deoxy-L-arabinose transferase-like glycosyltransferase